MRKLIAAAAFVFMAVCVCMSLGVAGANARAKETEPPLAAEGKLPQIGAVVLLEPTENEAELTNADTDAERNTEQDAGNALTLMKEQEDHAKQAPSKMTEEQTWKETAEVFEAEQALQREETAAPTQEPESEQESEQASEPEAEKVSEQVPEKITESAREIETAEPRAQILRSAYALLDEVRQAGFAGEDLDRRDRYPVFHLSSVEEAEQLLAGFSVKADLPEEYGKAFFETYDLYAVWMATDSGSYRSEEFQLSCREDGGTLYISIDLQPVARISRSCDMAGWWILVPYLKQSPVNAWYAGTGKSFE